MNELINEIGYSKAIKTPIPPAKFILRESRSSGMK